MQPAEPGSVSDLLAGEGAPNPLKRVVVPVHNTLFQLNDGVVGDLDASRAYFGATSGDVAVFDAEFLLDFRHTVFGVQRMHFVLSQSYEVSRSGEIVKHFVVS